MYEGKFPHKRYKKTLDFLLKHTPPPATILDLGESNPFVAYMKSQGYQVKNTNGEDLDFDQRAVQETQTDLVTAFEIFEHLLNPFAVLQAINAPKLLASVPLRLWFSSSYRNPKDDRDQHYHEFEPWQFDWLLHKTGWDIVASNQWTNPVLKIGIRPILRLFTPRYYIVYAKRK